MAERVKLTKEEFEALKKDMAKVSPEERKGKPLKQKWMEKFKINRNAAKAKGPEKIAVFLINQKGQLEGPFATQIYGGGFIVIRSMVYRYNPKRVITWGKHKVVIIRYFDRDLVKTTEDYEEVIAEGDDRTPLNDPVLIKALLNAKLAEKPQQNMSNAIWWILGFAVLALIGYVLYSRSQGAGK